MDYQTRKKIVTITQKCGLYRIAGYAAQTYAFFLHQKTQFEADRRARGWIDKRYAHLLEYKGIHKGEKCFVVATGPSLTLGDVEMLKGQYTFSVNSIVKLYAQTDWRPTYYVIWDSNVFSALQKEPYFQEMDDYFAASNLARDFHLPDRVKTFPVGMADYRYYYLDFSDKAFDTKFSDNAYAIVYAGGTVIYTALQLAAYMGFREIYLLGCDCDYSGEKQHFADFMTQKGSNNIAVSTMLIGYRRAKEYADAHGIKIYNATRGGKLEIFERVSLEEAVKRS